MTTIIAGGRDHRLTEDDFLWLDTMGITEVVTGGAWGVDSDALRWAKSRNIESVTFYPDWKPFGKRAGPIRNRKMAQYAKRCILFPGGKGTASMENEARRLGLEIIKRVYE